MQQIQPPAMQPLRDLALTGSVGAQVSDQLLGSQRLILADGRELQPAPRRNLSWQWQTTDHNQRLTAELDGITAWQPIAVNPPYYLDTDNATLGEIATSLTGAQLAHLHAMPSVPREQMAITAAQLRRVFTPKQLPLTEEPQLTKESTPIPHLTLFMMSDEYGGSRFGTRRHFDYGPIAVLPQYREEATRAMPLQEHKGITYLIVRNQHAEQDYAQLLYDLGLVLINTRLETEFTPRWMPRGQDT